MQHLWINSFCHFGVDQPFCYAVCEHLHSLKEGNRLVNTLVVSAAHRSLFSFGYRNEQLNTAQEISEWKYKVVALPKIWAEKFYPKYSGQNSPISWIFVAQKTNKILDLLTFNYYCKLHWLALFQENDTLAAFPRSLRSRGDFWGHWVQVFFLN